MQTILGAGGPVANSLASILSKKQEPVRLVSRSHQPAVGNTSWMKADLLKWEELLAAAKGSSVIYMCAGLRYDKKVWAAEWPRITDNLIRLAGETGARLIFFDNVYMYGHTQGAMTEKTPYHPSSVKGEIRARTAEKLMQAAEAGNIRVAIARAADFYGAESMNSFFDSMVLAKYAKGAKASWLGNPDAKHSFTYIPDAGRAVALLGEHPEADNQIWHLPTAPALTGRQFIELAARVFNAKPSYGTINKFMLTMAGIFNKLIGESVELYYQYGYDYVFDSSKFEQAFKVKATPYEEGMRQFAPFLSSR